MSGNRLVIFSDEVVKMKYLLLSLDRHVFRYLPRGSKENVLSAIIIGNITMSR